ncbi:MAG: (2Fe-2S)-binding protein [Phycisphaerales bacterium]|nr:(2Fe-2S)-binding protein [Phycisphaerales bacterium]
MPTITVDGRRIECRERQMVLQACLDAGVELPYYCYHPGLSIPASCRICLVEIEGIPKLVPSCQTPVREGMIVHSTSPKAAANRKAVMEYLLTSHPIDCPVCDQAGECFLQDYSYQYGRAEARFQEAKERQPKKDIGDHILLYSDRCIYCTRCVRFTREISGTCELYVNGRTATQQIDVFPGKPINNKLSGNVVDICPVGALLDKEFLFKQRVWLLKSAPSISPVDSGGENIYLDHNEGVIYRIRPRFNANVNKWWISDDTRYSYKVVYDPNRLRKPMRKQYGSPVETDWANALTTAEDGLRQLIRDHGEGCLYAMLSPMMACEEAWLLGRWIRSVDPRAALVLGPVPSSGEDETFHHYLTHQETFRIKAEKVPNAAGVRRVMDLLGGPMGTFDEFSAGTKAELKNLKGGWIVGGYLSNWIPAVQPELFKRGFKVVQELLSNSLSADADVLLPAAAWAEKEGCWINHQGLVQCYEPAVRPPESIRREGDVFQSLLHEPGLYNASLTRGRMGDPFACAAVPAAEEAEPAYEFQEL